MAAIRTRRLRRFAGSALAIALLAAVPAIVAARPQPQDRPESAQQVLAAVRSSGDRGYSGYAESHGTAAIPDVAELGTLPSLLGDTTKMRVWWNGSDAWRVDQITPISEDDTYAFPGGTWEWSSSRRTATAVTALAQVRLLRAADLTPDQLGRRLAALAAAPSSHVTRIGARRYAGRTALGVAITGSAATTVGEVQVWADAATGVPLAVTVAAKGDTTPTIATSYLSFDASRPKASTTGFLPPPDARQQQVTDSALRGVLGRLRPLRAPATLASLPASEVLPGEDGVATYADGLAQLAVVSLSRPDADRLRKDLASAAEQVDGTLQITTPLVDLQLADVGYRHLLLVGTVSQQTLTAAVQGLS